MVFIRATFGLLRSHSFADSLVGFRGAEILVHIELMDARCDEIYIIWSRSALAAARSNWISEASIYYSVASRLYLHAFMVAQLNAVSYS